MAKKTIFALGLILVGILLGLLVISAYTFSGGKTSITLLFLALAVILIIAGTIVGFSRLLDKIASPIVTEISEDVKDDLQDIKARRMTNTLWMLVVTIIGLIVFSFFVFRFHKMEAAWGGIPVIVPTFFGLVGLAVLIPRTRWFKESRDYTPMWIFLIPTIGLIITVWVGLARTENMRILSGIPNEVVQYNAIRQAGPIIQTVGEVGDFGLDLEMPDCDGEGCAVVLVIALVVLVFVLVIGSAMIPHFWLLSGSVLLGIMLLITIHDLRIRREIKNHSPKSKKLTDELEEHVSIEFSFLGTRRSLNHLFRGSGTKRSKRID
jgi:hypothetical protein